MTRILATLVLLTALLSTRGRADSPDPPSSRARAGEQACDPRTVRVAGREWARVFRVPASWIASLAYAESRWCPDATNESGATGLLQVKLSRARDLVRWLRRSAWRGDARVLEVLSRWRGVREDLLDPGLNVMLAAFDLHRLARKFHRDHDLVMAAYNQGEGVVGRHVERKIPLPPRAVEFIARVRKAREMGYT